MPPTTNVPEKLKPYICHGVRLNLDNVEGAVSVYGDCPWCQAEGRFNVTTVDGLWRCVKCNIGTKKGGGNTYTFLRILHDLSMEATVRDDYIKLAQDRKLLYPETLKAWGVCKSVITGAWLVPAYSVPIGTTDTGKLTQLYRYVPFQGKMTLMATAGLPAGLFGPDIPIPVGGIQVKRINKTGPVYRCEGPWDGMAMWEVAYRCRKGDEGTLVATSNSDASLLGTGSVVAVPGCNMFTENWGMASSGRPDYSFYDNDHPKEWPVKSGRYIQGGLDGSRRAIDVLSHLAKPPSQCLYLQWGHHTYHNPELPHGYDVRDWLSGAGNTLLDRIKALDILLSKLKPIPHDWVPGRHQSASTKGSLVIQEQVCKDWKSVLNAMRGTIKVTPGIERTFACMLASILSVPSVGDQLWLLVIGPPSSAKSTLCEAISTNRQYVLPKDTLTGLFSGWQAGLDAGENISMANEMYDKTLVIKDGDTILRATNRDKIMSELRALYDRCVRVQFKNRQSKDHEGLNATVILCGTAAMLEMDANDRGARYLTVDIQPKADYSLEDEITLRAAHSGFNDMTILANGTAESRDNPKMTIFKQLTSGYITYLRENASSLIEAVTADDETLLTIGKLATFVSYLRCRAPKKQDEKVEREMPYRLTKQLVRLARGLAVVLNKGSIDADVLDRVRSVALDTARGKVMVICDYIRSAGAEGVSSTGVGHAVGESQEEAIKILRFLRKIDAVEARLEPPRRGYVRTARPVWHLSSRLAGLYDHIFGQTPDETRSMTNPHRGRMEDQHPELLDSE